MIVAFAAVAVGVSTIHSANMRTVTGCTIAAFEEEIEVVANDPVTWYDANVGVNTVWDPTNCDNGVNKIDLFGRVANTGTDKLYVRAFVVHSDFN